MPDSDKTVHNHQQGNIEQEIKALKHQRGILKGQVTRFSTFLNSFNVETSDIKQLKSRISKFEPLFEQFQDIQTKIELLTDIIDDEREEYENSYFNIHSMAEKYYEEALRLKSIKTTIDSQNIETTDDYVKLPPINLPTFNGEYDKWLMFSETFDAVVHQNRKLTNSRKFQYLRSCLQGEALNVIRSLEISNDNYQLAWDLLKKRYHDTKHMVYTHIRAIFEIPDVSKEASANLRNLVDSIQKHIRALKILKQPVEHWDLLLIYILSNKLDYYTNRDWESLVSKKPDEEMPALDEFIDFLNQRCKVLETINRNKPDKSKSIEKYQKYNSSKSATFVATDTTQCELCNQHHKIYSCKKFLDMSIPERINYIKRSQRCYNCLTTYHLTKNCDRGNCKKCNKKHATLLHLDGHSNYRQSNIQQTFKPSSNQQVTQQATNYSHDQQSHQQNSTIQNKDQPNQSVDNTNQHCTQSSAQSNDARSHHSHQSSSQNDQSVVCHSYENISSQIILSTAIVMIPDSEGQDKYFKVLLDSASQSNFITKQTCKQLGLQPKKVSHTVTSFGNISSTITEEIETTIYSTVNKFKVTLKYLVVPEITDNLPLVSMSKSQFRIPPNIKLADPEFYKPSKINILVGAEIFYDILCIGQIKESKYSPTFKKTNFGWIVSGKFCAENSQNHTVCNFTVLEKQIEQFWTIEDVKQKRNYSKEEEECEHHFTENVSRSDDGQFVVRLPFNKNKDKIGESKIMAMRRFLSQEQKLLKNDNMRREYIEFLKEYESLGHMKVVTDIPLQHYYLPHHAVTKQDSLTTKVRVVFDGSAPTSSGVSLNQALKKGPTIQDDLVEILSRFRLHNIVFTADITKMYRQVRVNDEDANYQLILWRQDPTENIQTYKLRTVTYGTTTAPFLAVRCLKQIAIEQQFKYPEASRILEEDFYVDDMLTGFDKLENAENVLRDLNFILNNRHFNLRKWRSNKPETLNKITQNGSNDVMMMVNPDTTVKTLGLYWNSKLDVFQYQIEEQDTRKITKRNILSTIARLYDPLGLLGPILTLAKLVMQEIWQIRSGWDESVPETIHNKWTTYLQNLRNIQELKIQRKITNHDTYINIELHGFCDASQLAYGACVYVRTTGIDNTYSVQLLSSKSRVAPLKTISLPRLELCGALLLAQLTEKIRNTMKIKFNKIYLWTDSTITLAWISMSPNKCKTFISNRITEIQNLTSCGIWQHIAGTENPADLISRGKYPSEIKSNKLWWNGPLWLQQHENSWPKFNDSNTDKFNPNDLEMKKQDNIICTSTTESSIFTRYSTLTQLQRITSWCLRFKHNTINKTSRITGNLTVKELQNATKCLVKLTQLQEYSAEFKQLQNYKFVKPCSKIYQLNPFLDEDSMLRVGGRIRHANIPYLHKHPYLLPHKHPLTTLIIRHEHLLQMHAGSQTVLHNLRLKYWIPSGKNAIKNVIRSCITCFRACPKITNQHMGNLPKQRVIEANPFEITGVDFGGPMMIRESHRRGKVHTSKCYIAVFICFVTKAIHLELVTSLTTEAFIATLKRFISRRGNCKHIYSDNATNFQGSKNELNEIYKLLTNQPNSNKITKELTNKQISWHFIPPRSPHFGGLWESSVKSVKTHIKKVIGEALLTFEEYSTLLSEIEFCLNSRPLTPLSNDPSDLSPLTPNHFLLGYSSIGLEEINLTQINDNKLSRWQHLQKMKQHIWQRWRREYLSNLQQRSKWNQTSPNFQVGDMVLVLDNQYPSSRWPLGRVIDTHPGSDKLVRVVTVKLKSGIVKRAINKVAKLPIMT